MPAEHDPALPAVPRATVDEAIPADTVGVPEGLLAVVVALFVPDQLPVSALATACTRK